MTNKTKIRIKINRTGEIDSCVVLNPNNSLGVDSFEEGFERIKGYLDELRRTESDPFKKCGIFNAMEMFFGISDFLSSKKDFENLLKYIEVTTEQFKQWSFTMGDSCLWARRFID